MHNNKISITFTKNLKAIIMNNINNLIEDYYQEFETNDFDFYNDLNNY